ncbi:MAG: hypothetical protein V2A74_04010, partial [bacterium]
FDGTDWYQVPTGATPSPRGGHQVVFDRNVGQSILFGGASGLGREVGALGTSGVSGYTFVLNFIPPRLVRAVFRARPSTTVTNPVTSNVVRLTFNQEMRIGDPSSRLSAFFMPVSGDTLGSEFSMELASLNRRQVNVTLGIGPNFTATGVFDSSVSTAGSPSAIDVSAPFPSPPPLTNRFGVPPVDSGIVGVNDTGLDIGEILGANERVYNGTEGGTVNLLQTAGLEYRKHSVHVPLNTFSAGQSWQFLMEPAIEDLGVQSAFTVRASQLSGGAALAQGPISTVVFSQPIPITVEYQDNDFNPAAGQRETMMRICRLVETTTGTLGFEPVLDVTGAPQVQDLTSKTVSVQVDQFHGPSLGTTTGASLQQTGGVETFANIALDIVNENTINITPSPGSSVKLSAGSVSLVPGLFSGYTKHVVEIPNYATAPSGTGTKLTIRTATSSERQGFPTNSNAIFSVASQNAQTGQNVSFTDPVNLTVEYKVTGDPLFTSDVMDLNGITVTEADMTIVRRNSTGGSYTFQGGTTVNEADNTVKVMGVTNLTSNGIGTWGAVGLSFAPVNFGFDTSSEGWSFITIPLPDFTAPTSGATGGVVSLHSTTNTNTFGFWQSPSGAFPVVSDRLYRAIFRVTTDVVTPSQVPGIRPRLNNLNGQTSAFISIDSNGAATDVTTPAGKDYEVYFLPFQGGANGLSGEMTASFDLINFSPNDAPVATMSLDEITVDSEALGTVEAKFTPVSSYTFDASSQGRSFVSLPGLFGDATSSASGGALSITAGTNVNAFGFWQSPSLTVTDNTVYRFRYAIRTSVATQSQVPGIRLRANTLSGESAAALRIDSGGDGLSSPVPGVNSFYDLYFRPGPSGVASGMNTSADLINFNTADALNGDIIIDAVSVDKATVPLF